NHMNQSNKSLTRVILVAAIAATALGILVASSLAQPSGKPGAKKVGEAVKPSSAAKTGDKAAGKLKAEAPKTEPRKADAQPADKNVPPAVKDPEATAKAAEQAHE